MLRTSPGPFAVGAAAAPWEAFPLSAMSFLQFSPVGAPSVVCPSSQGLEATFPPTAAQHKATGGPHLRRPGGEGSVVRQACQLDQRRTAIAITGPSNGTD
ncbi:hypothetical protein GCM10023161_02640 [Mycobacterium paraffinicum]|uniref:Secreted protein n=1 Tax=Mycobacterium paraffinicum TaxID=53378 RepID=A0ABP8RAC9_9MYCO